MNLNLTSKVASINARIVFVASGAVIADVSYV